MRVDDSLSTWWIEGDKGQRIILQQCQVRAVHSREDGSECPAGSKEYFLSRDTLH